MGESQLHEDCNGPCANPTFVSHLLDWTVDLSAATGTLKNCARVDLDATTPDYHLRPGCS
jgi:hypothetical protein